MFLERRKTKTKSAERGELRMAHARSGVVSYSVHAGVSRKSRTLKLGTDLRCARVDMRESRTARSASVQCTDPINCQSIKVRQIAHMNLYALCVSV